MKVGLHLPQLGRAASLDLVVEVAMRAEALGFDNLWTADHIAVPTSLQGMPSFFPEPIPLLSAAAAHTSRIGLGTGVLVPAYRNPMQFAKQWATLDWLAPGRTILGVGAGWLEPEFDACGVSFAERGRRLDEYIKGWRTAWCGGTEYQSKHWSFSGVRVKPQPGGPIPIWIGGASAGALRRAAWCDGWQGTWAPVEVLSERLTLLEAELERIGRSRAEITVSIHCEVRIGESLESAGRWARVGDGYGSRPTVTGTVDRVVEVIEPYIGAGIDHVLLVPLAPSVEEWREHVEALAEVRERLTKGGANG